MFASPFVAARNSLTQGGWSRVTLGIPACVLFALLAVPLSSVAAPLPRIDATTMKLAAPLSNLATPVSVLAAPPVTLQFPGPVTAPWPPSNSATDPHPEKISILTGEADKYEFSHARAYIHAPLAKVLEAFRQPDVMVDRRRVTEWKTTHGVDNTFPFSFNTHYIIKSIVTVEMPITWRGVILKGTLKAPESICFRSEKVGGTNFVPLLEDSIIAKAVDEKTTAIEFIRHAKGMRYGKKDCAQYQQDLFESILSFVKGKPLPTYE
jgi:hypothetical protein